MTGLGPGIVRSWTTGEGGELHIVIVPICRGTGSLVFLKRFTRADFKREVDVWVESFQWLAPGQVPTVCSRFNPR